MKSWWQRRSVRFRLALWYAAATAVVLIAFAWFVYEVIEHRLGADLDRQLRSDFELIEAQVDLDADEGARWNVHGPHGDEANVPISGWFDVWSENGELLLRHWPFQKANANNVLPPLRASTLSFTTVELERGLFVRVMDGPGQVEARRITSESLSKRLPNPNPSDELGRLATVFNDTLARLEASFAELQRFTADASHELRSPLTALRAVGEVALRDGNDPAALRETIGSMLEEAQRLTDLVDALLTLARMDATKADAAREEVNIAALLDEVRDQFEVLANEKRQTIAVTSDDNLTVQADRTLLHLALVNLVHNAIQHGPADSKISITGVRSARKIDISVKDNGPGIPGEYHEKVFERFFRIDKARSRARGGAGLGLAIAKQSVE